MVHQLLQLLQCLEVSNFYSILSSFLVLVLCFFIFKVHGVWWSSSRTSKSHYNLPPSPPTFPVIGNLHQLGTLAHRSFDAISHKYGPLLLLKLGQSRTVLVSTVELATEIMKNQDIVFANRPFTTAAKAYLYGCIDIGFAPYGEYWTQVRRICVQEMLSNKRVQSFNYVRVEEIDTVVKKITSTCAAATVAGVENVINLSQIILTINNRIISRCALGPKYAEGLHESRFGELCREVMQLMGAFSFADYLPSVKWLDNFTGFNHKISRTSRDLNIFLDKVVDEHFLLHKSPDSDPNRKLDLIDILIFAQKDNPNIGRDNIKAIIMDMFVGGSETSATTMEWTMAELIKNPEVMKKAQDEIRRIVGKKAKIEESDIIQMDYLKCVVKEILRIHPAIPTLVPRLSSKDTKLQGYDIPANTVIYINAWTIHRNTKYWDNPEEFRPERFINNPLDFKGQEFHYIPFGSGRRGCPGIAFGTTSIEFTIANLLYWFDWDVPAGQNMEKLDMTEAIGLTVNKKLPIYAVPTLYSP
ncbi:hypothetical protein C5167_018464 [Papaver somniferum]|uniref:Cytochrome P450 n=1 Tax=Papaver somniferum TaxID=3469 RepID=A0A4Y7IPJ5_PAPSO|nr:cytochrome P450 71A1-like [Papaver somniferum]RZC50036.1 hypothetical protein C5167_018464 [Papaver somniferum]